MKKAVLFLIFNRLDTTQVVFEQIKVAKPPKLYLASDGAREDKDGEALIVSDIRKWVLDNVDWDCEIKTLFREENLGCGQAVSSAITWFFEHEEDGIILEDDCVPAQSFFNFCEQMLDKYKNDERIMHICGSNLQFGNKRVEASYYFSKIAGCWGWATWRRMWEKFDYNMKSFPKFVEQNQMANIYESKNVQYFWLNNFSYVYKNPDSIWDFQMVYAVMSNNGLSIIPNTNLIKNIGFSDNSTHPGDKNNSCAKLEKFELAEEITHPNFILYSKEADDYIHNKLFKTHKQKKKSIGQQIIDKLRGKKQWI